MADKKILDEEMMSDDELDNVVGGTNAETIALMKAIGPVAERRDYTGDKVYTELTPTELASYLKNTYGIDATINCDARIRGPFEGNGNKANEYSLNGKSLTQQQVLKMVSGK